jgi:hypothetical protein
MKKAFTWIADNINTQAFTNLYDSILFVIDFIVSRTSESLAGILIKALPLLAPVPNAVSVWRISQSAPLHYDTLQAGALAASVEGMFFALTEVVLNMFDGYLIDKERYKWPLRIAGGLLIGFFLLVEVIVLFIETNMVAMAFPFISLIAAVALGCARWHSRHATQTQPKRKQMKVSAPVQIASIALPMIAQPSEAPAHVRAYAMQTAGNTIDEIALALNVSKRTVNNYIAKAKEVMQPAMQMSESGD